MGIWTWLHRFEAPADGPWEPAERRVRRLPVGVRRSDGPFAVVLVDPGPQFMPVLDAIADVTGADVGEACALRDGAPAEVVLGVARARAEAIRARLVELGADADIESVRDVARPSVAELDADDRARRDRRAARSVLRDRYADQFSGRADAPAPIEEIHTHRAWHALHVALTGCEVGGARPAAEVVGVDSHAWSDMDPLVLWPADVRRVASYLADVDFDGAVRTLYAAIARGVDVYSFEDWDGGDDMVQAGLFRRVFLDVRGFYRDAARGGQLVVIHRG